MEFVYQYSASGKDYSEVFSHYQTRELTQEERMEGIWGEIAIIFDSLEELMRFEGEVGQIVIGEGPKKDGTYFKSIVIYDDYLE